MFTYGKLNLLLINGINLVFSYLEMQRRFIETNLYKFFSLCLERHSSQTFESNNCRILFPKCVCYWHCLLRGVFFIPCDNWKTLFFIPIYHYPEVFCNCHVVMFFETSALEEVHILCPLSLQ